MENLKFKTQLISWRTILNIWETKLWKNRDSAIETHSAMTWPYSGPIPTHSMRVFDYIPYFIGVYDGDKLIGVNSGHRTDDKTFRSRGLWVDPAYRKQGIAQLLFETTEQLALIEGCTLIWSVPRKTALSAYERFGFKTQGDFFGTETSEANIYAYKVIGDSSEASQP